VERPWCEFRGRKSRGAVQRTKIGTSERSFGQPLLPQRLDYYPDLLQHLPAASCLARGLASVLSRFDQTGRKDADLLATRQYCNQKKPIMSFGRPPGFTTFSVTPPDRGSFPLDHEGEYARATGQRSGRCFCRRYCPPASLRWSGHERLPSAQQLVHRFLKTHIFPPPPSSPSMSLSTGECTSVMREYMTCLKQNKQDNGKCRHLSRRYLECRMEK
jgi:hypothetical protein